MGRFGAPSCAEYNTIKIKMWGAWKTSNRQRGAPTKKLYTPRGVGNQKDKGGVLKNRTAS